MFEEDDINNNFEETDAFLISKSTSDDLDNISIACDKITKTIKNDKSANATRKLMLAALLSVTFMVIEIIGGYFANSLAVMSDAAHLITDSLTFIIGIVGVKWGKKRANDKMSFGYRRIEIICAMVSVLGIWIMTMFICYSAIERLYNSSIYNIDTDTMLIVAVLGIIINIVMAMVLHGSSCHHHNHSHHGHGHRRSSGDDEMKVLQIDDNDKTIQSEAENINVQAALLHVLGDFLQSVGVILAAVIIKIYPQAKFVDPLVTILFSIIVIFTTLKIMKKSYHIIMESVPSHINYNQMKEDLLEIKGIQELIKLRIWSLTSDYHLLTLKLMIKSVNDYENTLQKTKEIIFKKYAIEDVTIEIEIEKNI